jgi:tetratricopeptide (TPR) repeat protein
MLRPVVVVVLVVAALAAHPAAAAGGSEKEARALFQHAEMNFNLGKFSEALTDYQGAYEAKPLPGFLFNIAQCYRNLSNYERARFFYRRYLALDPHTSNRRLVEDLISEMTRLLDKQEAAAAATPPPPPPPSSPAPESVAPVVERVTAPRPAPTHGEEPAAALIAKPAPEPEPARRPVYKRWWFWAAAGAAVAGGVAAAFLLTRNTQPTGSLPPIEAR